MVGAIEKVQRVTVGPDEAGQRIDNYLFRKLKGVPKGHIYRILRRGEVRVNSGRVKPTYRLQDDDEVRIPPVRQGIAQPQLKSGGFQWLEEHIIYEDAGLLVLDKPSGLAVHGGSGLSFGVIEALRVQRPESYYLELVHRLDRDTSGCLLIAKRRSVLRALHDQLRSGAVEKIYLALTAGSWPGGRQRVDLPLRKFVLQGGERMVRVDDAGKEALTFFAPKERYPTTTLVEVQLKTGRTHQIRVHAAAVDHPIAGDMRYGDESFNQEMRTLGLNRLFLHAQGLKFTLPGSDERQTFTAPLPAELQLLLSRLAEVK